MSFRDLPETAQALDALLTGDISIVGRMPWSSNATFLVDVVNAGVGEMDGKDAGAEETDFPIQAVYKPVRGERQLWDFPPGLHKRERACFLLSEALGWNLVPPTIIRDGPLGEGSLQLFVLADFEHHYFTIRQIDSLGLQLRRLCAFDFVANSTDRKSGHVLLTAGSEPESENEAQSETQRETSEENEAQSETQRESQSETSEQNEPQNETSIFAIDNGLSFHSDFKLRTVLWDYSGEPLPQCVMSDLAAFLARPAYDELLEVLSSGEVDAALERAELLLESGVFPTDPSGQRWPWPIV